jgi:uncharacterized membrane protein
MIAMTSVNAPAGAVGGSVMRTSGRVAVLVAAFMLGTGLLPVAAEVADPLQRLRSGDVVVDSQRRRHGGIVDARIFVPAPPRLVYTFIADPHQLPRYSPEIISVRILEDHGSRKRVRMHVRQFGVIDDESEVLGTYQPYELVTWKQVKGRLASFEGFWKVGSMDQGTVLAYHVNVDAGMALPAFIIEAFLRSTVPSVLKNVRRQFGDAAALPALFSWQAHSPSP